MELMGRRSLASVLKVLVDVGFYAFAVGGALVAGLAVVIGLGVVESTRVDQSWPVAFDLDPAAYQVESATGEDVRGSIAEATGTLNVTGPAPRRAAVPVLLVALLLAVAATILHRLRLLLRRLREGRPFVAENVKHLRFIGLAVIAGELIRLGIVWWSSRLAVVGLETRGVTFRDDVDLNLIVILAGAVLLVIAEVFRQGTQMRADMETAREIQFSLLPEGAFERGRISIRAQMQPARIVGGDYYDVIELDDGKVGFLVADVAGKGLPAALLMTLLKGSVRSLISAGLRGGSLVRQLNTHLVANTPGNRLVTFFYGELDTGSGDLLYVNAGHNPPFLVSGSTATGLVSTGLVLGVMDGAPFEEARVTIPPGAELLLYTDGITEAINPQEEEFGEKRLERLLREQGPGDPKNLLRAVTDAVTRFSGSAPQADDMTLMLVSRAAG